MSPEPIEALDPTSPAAALASEIEVRRAAAERQSSHLAARLKMEHASYAQLSAEYEAAMREGAARTEEVMELRVQNDALQRELREERARGAGLSETIALLKEEAHGLREAVAQTERNALMERSLQAEQTSGLVEQQVSAEADRSRDVIARLESALREARERETNAVLSVESRVATTAAEGERRVRQLRLQLEQLREAAESRDRETAEAIDQQRIAERSARIAQEQLAGSGQRVAELEARVRELQSVTAEKDTLQVRADQLGRLVDAQSSELRRLQEAKAKAKAANGALRRQLLNERQVRSRAPTSQTPRPVPKPTPTP